MQSLQPYQTTIDAAEDKVLELAEIIFKKRDLSKVEEEIFQACKIVMGLQALQQSSTETDDSARQRIIVTLNHMCGVYNQQTVPIITI